MLEIQENHKGENKNLLRSHQEKVQVRNIWGSMSLLESFLNILMGCWWEQTLMLVPRIPTRCKVAFVDELCIRAHKKSPPIILWATIWKTNLSSSSWMGSENPIEQVRKLKHQKEADFPVSSGISVVEQGPKKSSGSHFSVLFLTIPAVSLQKGLHS